jgi:hypothetical protein
VYANASIDQTAERPTIAATVIRAARSRLGNRSPATAASTSAIGSPKRSGPDCGSEPTGYARLNTSATIATANAPAASSRGTPASRTMA